MTFDQAIARIEQNLADLTRQSISRMLVDGVDPDHIDAFEAESRAQKPLALAEARASLLAAIAELRES